MSEQRLLVEVRERKSGREGQRKRELVEKRNKERREQEKDEEMRVIGRELRTVGDVREALAECASETRIEWRDVDAYGEDASHVRAFVDASVGAAVIQMESW